MARVARQRRAAAAVAEPASRELAARKGKRRRPREESGQPAERDEKRQRVPPCSSQRVCSQEGAQQLTEEPLQTEEPFLREPVVRPGVPAPTDTQAFVVPDRPSPPLREDSKASPGRLAALPYRIRCWRANIQSTTFP